MGKMTETPRYNVISLRITDAELAAIHTLRDGSAQSISDFMRSVLSVFISNAAGNDQDGSPGESDE